MNDCFKENISSLRRKKKVGFVCIHVYLSISVFVCVCVCVCVSLYE